MKDTSHEMQRRFEQMLMSRPGEERVRMASSMYDTARRLVLASLRAEKPDATPADLRKGLFLRFYGRDFGPQETERILNILTA